MDQGELDLVWDHKTLTCYGPRRIGPGLGPGDMDLVWDQKTWSWFETREYGSGLRPVGIYLEWDQGNMDLLWDHGNGPGIGPGHGTEWYVKLVPGSGVRLSDIQLLCLNITENTCILSFSSTPHGLLVAYRFHSSQMARVHWFCSGLFLRLYFSNNVLSI